MMALGRGYVESDSVVFTVGEDGDERREINLVRRLIKGPICSNRPIASGDTIFNGEVGAKAQMAHLHKLGSIPPVKITG